MELEVQRRHGMTWDRDGDGDEGSMGMIWDGDKDKDKEILFSWIFLSFMRLSIMRSQFIYHETNLYDMSLPSYHELGHDYIHLHCPHIQNKPIRMMLAWHAVFKIRASILVFFITWNLESLRSLESIILNENISRILIMC